MSPRLARVLALVIAGCFAGGLALAVEACGSDSNDGGGGSGGADGGGGVDGVGRGVDGDNGSDDSGTDSASTDAGTDGAATGSGETCIGFAKGSPCGDGGLPDYGYVCFNGGPPGFTGCKQASKTSFGDTWCCPENKCVAQPDQDSKYCSNPAKPHRYQCPPDGNGSNVMPAASCGDGGSGSSPVETFYCCP